MYYHLLVYQFEHAIFTGILFIFDTTLVQYDYIMRLLMTPVHYVCSKQLLLMTHVHCNNIMQLLVKHVHCEYIM